MEVDEPGDSSSPSTANGGQPKAKRRRVLPEEKKKKMRKNPNPKAADSDDDEAADEPPPAKKTKKPPRVLNDADEGRTVFVRNVNFASTAEALREYFEAQTGPVQECRVVCDRLTEHSRGLAFVKFRAKSDADACLLKAAANDGAFRLDGSTLRLCLAVTRERLGQLDKAPLGGASAATGLDARKRPSAGKRNLHLARAGQLRRGSREAEGVPEAELALREQLERRAREALRNPDVMVSPTRLCVHGLPRDLSDRDLRRAFQRLGGPGCRVTECRVMRDTARLDGDAAQLAPGAKVAGRSRGFAFVAYGDHEHAMRAVEAAVAGPSLPEGRRLVVQFSLERQSALRKKMMAGRKLGPATDDASAAPASGLMSRVPKPAGAQGGIPKAPKRRARHGAAGGGAAAEAKRKRMEQRRQVSGRLSRKEFRRKRKEALVRDGRLKAQ